MSLFDRDLKQKFEKMVYLQQNWYTWTFLSFFKKKNSSQAGGSLG